MKLSERAEDWIQRQPYFNPSAPDLIDRVAEATSIIRDFQEELADGDYWMERHENMVENGGCPVCFRDDESIGTHGHFPGCELALLAAKLTAIECGDCALTMLECECDE